MTNYLEKKKLLALLTLLGFILTGCMTLRNFDTDNKSVSSVNIDFSGKTVAILPVYADDALLTDSQLILKKNINKELDIKVTALITDATVIPSSETIQILTDNDRLDILDKMAATYKRVGIFSRKDTGSIIKELGCDFIVASALNCEKVNVVLLKAVGASLDVALVDSNNKIVWNGTGDYKHGGVYGAGSVDSVNIAKEVVKLAFQARWADQNSKDATPKGPSKSESTKTEETPVETKVEPAPESLPQISLNSKLTIIEVQKRLNDLGLNAGTADGILGKKTKRAIGQYQKIKGLNVTNEVDMELIKALGIIE